MLLNTSYKYSPAFEAKIPTRDVISLATQRHLSGDFRDILDATDKMTGRKNSIHDLVANGNQCRDALLEQFPILKEVRQSADKFFKNANRTDEELDSFVNSQIKKIGSEELDVQPIKINPTVYMQYNSQIASKKPVIALIVE